MYEFTIHILEFTFSFGVVEMENKIGNQAVLVSENAPNFNILPDDRTAARVAKTIEIYGTENPGRALTTRVLESQKEKYGYWLPDLGQTRDDEAVIRALNNGAFVDTIGGYGETALNRAVKGGEISTLRILLQAGADANFRNDICDGYPILVAAARHSLAMVQALREYGADFDVKTDSGQTILHVAIPSNFDWEHNSHSFDQNEAVALMNYLLENCGSSLLLDIPDSRGVTPRAILQESTHFRLNDHGAVVKI